MNHTGRIKLTVCKKTEIERARLRYIWFMMSIVLRSVTFTRKILNCDFVFRE